MDKYYNNTVGMFSEGVRIDKYLASYLTDHSRSFIQKLIEDKHVKVNDSHVKSNYRLKENDTIQVIIPKVEKTQVEAENIPLHIIYEDADLIIVNKDQGMVVHPAKGNLSGTLVNALLYYAGDNLSTVKGEIRPGIVHRIDKDTSGLLMVAKNNRTHEKLAAMLKKREITRKYQAIVFGNFKEETGIIDAPIGRHPVNRKLRTVTQKNARDAQTSYQVLQQFRGFSHVEVTLITGRTHQIRVHMNHIGHPILGDPLYGPKKQPYNLAGQLLHAKTLGFHHPTTGEYMVFDAPLAENFIKTINTLPKDIL